MDEQLLNQTTVFAFDLLKQLYTPGTNLVLSPYSLLTVLTMALIGAGGNSRLQMIRAMYNPGATLTYSEYVQPYVRFLSRKPEESRHLDEANLMYLQSG